MTEREAIVLTMLAVALGFGALSLADWLKSEYQWRVRGVDRRKSDRRVRR